MVIMATASLSLDQYWAMFIKNQIKSGCYGSASEVIHSALMHLEEQKQTGNSACQSLCRRIPDSRRGALNQKQRRDNRRGHGKACR